MRLTQLKELWTSKDTQILMSEQLERLRLFQETPLGPEMSYFYLDNFKNIKSQLLQEVYALSVLKGKKVDISLRLEQVMGSIALILKTPKGVSTRF